MWTARVLKYVLSPSLAGSYINFLKTFKGCPLRFCQNLAIILCYVDASPLGGYKEELRKRKYKLAMKVPADDLDKATDFVPVKSLQGQDYVEIAQRMQVNPLIKQGRLTESHKVNFPCDVFNDLSIPGMKLLTLLLYADVWQKFFYIKQPILNQAKQWWRVCWVNMF